MQTRFFLLDVHTFLSELEVRMRCSSFGAVRATARLVSYLLVLTSWLAVRAAPGVKAAVVPLYY